jgi:hypothetical protein
MSCHFWWYVERHITHLEAPKGQSNQSGLRDFKR